MSSRRTVSGTRTPGQLLPERFFVQRYRKSCSAHPSTSNSGSDASSSTPPPTSPPPPPPPARASAKFFKNKANYHYVPHPLGIL